MESEILEQIEDRLIREFLDVLILGELTKGRPLGGHDVIKLLGNKFGILLSSGTVYSAMYSMEREDLIVSALDGRRKVYLLTDKGKETIKTISSAKQKIISLISKLC